MWALTVGAWGPIARFSGKKEGSHQLLEVLRTVSGGLRELGNGWPRRRALLSGPHGDEWFKSPVFSRLGVPAVRPTNPV